MKIGLGTVQFGLDYGVSNKEGKTSQDEVRKILSYADEHGITYLDTAGAYGESEEVLGKLLSVQNPFNIITKIQVPLLDRLPTGFIRDELQKSLQRLNTDHIYGLLIHNADALIGKDAPKFWEQMIRIKEQEKVTKIGVSVYSPEQLKALLQYCEIDLVQIPVNIFDQRFLEEDLLRGLKDKNIEIHARSIFLQGLLLMNPENLKPGFESVKESLELLRDYTQNSGRDMVTAAIEFAYSIHEIDKLIVGVSNKAQLREILGSVSKLLERGDSLSFSKFKISDEQIINPSLWHQT